MKLTNILITILLAVSVTNLVVTTAIPQQVVDQILGAEQVPSQTVKTTAQVKFGSVTVPVPIEVTTTQGEDTPDNVANPKSAETTTQWNKRTLDTLKSAYDDAVAYGQ